MYLNCAIGTCTSLKQGKSKGSKSLGSRSLLCVTGKETDYITHRGKPENDQGDVVKMSESS